MMFHTIGVHLILSHYPYFPTFLIAVGGGGIVIGYSILKVIVYSQVDKSFVSTIELKVRVHM